MHMCKSNSEHLWIYVFRHTHILKMKTGLACGLKAWCQAGKSVDKCFFLGGGPTEWVNGYRCLPSRLSN